MRLLIVEDEERLRNTLKRALEAEFFAVDTAEDGKEGSRLARINNYDLIILDNILPHKTGLEVCYEIREDKRTTPIIVLSVKTETTTKVELLNAGADDYIIKPFSFDELLARMHALLRRPKAIEEDVLRVGGIELDNISNIVKKDGKEVALTRKEYMLLKYLMTNEGTVLSRGMIMDHVWDMNADPFSNTIEAHILSLRRKLEDKSKLICTIPGRGYKLKSTKLKVAGKN
ncbi:MAG: response regulator transcription factor [Candidatus Spechtbacterales bacterium]|nr:response regulator transcription factor [Candidatus Spechtbacterales bacterium]